MILYTTLALLKQQNACADRYRHLKLALGKYDDDKPIPLWRILATNGVNDAYWALRAVPEKQSAWRDRLARLHACDCVCSTPMPDRRTTYELLTDPRSRNAIEIAERFALGKANSSELTAAWVAAGDVARVAWDAARAAEHQRCADAVRVRWPVPPPEVVAMLGDRR